MWFQKFKLVEKRYSFFTRFDEVGGLDSGDPIVVNGVEKGRVQSISLGNREVIVEMGIKEGVMIPRDSRIVLKSIGIMGERFVAVTHGESALSIAPGDTIDGQFLMGLSEVMGAAGAILDELAETSRSLHDILDGFARDGKLQASVDNLAATSETIRALTTDNKPRLDDAIAGFQRVSSRMDSLLENHYASMDSSMTSFGRAGGKVETAVENLSRASSNLKEITEKLQSGEGSLGKLLADDELVDKLNATITDLDSLVNDILLHPGRYVTLKLF
jgi:phospholipid/cholesterol/gamma-HCH transport system substrate-binding protein